MNKIILLSIITTLSFASTTDLEKRLNQLELQIKTLKEQTSSNKADLDEYIPIVEASETKSLLDKIDFLPELETRIDKMQYINNGIEGENTKIVGGYYDGMQRRDEFTKDFGAAVTTKMKINFGGKIDDNTKFHGRMIFGISSQSHERLCILSRDIKSVSSSSTYDVDRAYVDYTPNTSSEYAFTFSFGVLPTTGGTPMNYAQNSERKSMFPALVFDMNTYGIIGTQKLGEDNYLRVIAAKAYTLRAAFYPYQCNRENIDNANILGLYFDTKLGFLDDSLLSFGVNFLGDFKAHPYLGADINADDSHELGDIFTFGLGLDVNNIKDSGLTAFIHTAISHPNGNGQPDDYQMTDENSNGLDDDSGFSTASYAQGEMLKEDGHSLYLGLKYDIDEKFNFGAEYNHGSKYWFSATQGAEDMYNKLATRGDAGELYSIWKFHNFMFAKFGYLYIQEDYTGSGWHFGEPAKKDAIQKIFYVSIKAEF